MPNVSSMLPEYGNLEQDLIGRAFNAANYDAIARLPADIDHSTVAGARRMAIEAARTAAAAPHDGTRNARRNGLFSEFEYSQSEYDLYNQLENKAREEHKAIMATISGTEFKLPGSICKGKYQDGFQEGGLYPYLSDPYEAAHEMALRLKWISQAQMLSGPWSNPGHDKLGDRPSRHLAGEIMAHLRKLIVEDWEDADVTIYPNEDEQWVVRFVLNEAIDSEAGLTAYMNCLLRTNPIVLKYQLTKVVEHWDIFPGDGCAYYTVRPPWVAQPKVEAFFTLHPEERDLQTLLQHRQAEPPAPKASAKGRNWRGVVR